MHLSARNRVLVLAAATGCGSFDKVVADAAIDAPPDAMLDAMRDAAPDAFVCPADTYEPNGTIAQAYVTNVAGTALTQTMSASLCLGPDRDYFKVDITVAGQSLELLVDPSPTDDTLVQASILNSGGVSIANAIVMTVSPRRLRAFAANLPVGTYYAETFMNQGASGAHAYTATVTVTGP